MTTIFLAYPGSPSFISANADFLKENATAGISYKDWRDIDNWGKDIIQPILDEISLSDVLCADITALNNNVAFEVGFAIAKRKKVLLVLNTAVPNDSILFKKIGVYDTLGYKGYTDITHLVGLLRRENDTRPYKMPKRQAKSKSPVYIIEAADRAASTASVISQVKKSGLRFHSYNPQENARLAGPTAIEDVARADGIICPLLSESNEAAKLHNIRASFAAGLAVGLGKQHLIYWIGDANSPLDIRDLGHYLTHPDDLKSVTSDFIVRVYAERDLQTFSSISDMSDLEKLNLGDPTAENEFQTLGQYYIPTDEFQRARRGEVNLVVGRKGSGKTALLAQLRDKTRSSISNIVVDLLPDGYQLVRLKEQIIDKLDDGAALHLISTYWQYIIYSEIAYKVLEKDKKNHTRNRELSELYRNLEQMYLSYEFHAGTGDFSERMSGVAENMADAFDSVHSNSDGNLRLSAPQVTQFMHEAQISKLRHTLVDYLRRKDEVWLLFDNLDKGWKSYGLAKNDIFILRCLLEANRKVSKTLKKAKVPYTGILFVRNDVYQLMVREDPDFGKSSRAALDWTDRSQLKRLVVERVRAGLGLPKSEESEKVLARVMTPSVQDVDAMDYMINHSMMRPRALLKIINYARATAVNKGLERITEECIIRAVEMHADDLLVDASNEIRDITGTPDTLYSFLETDPILSKTEISTLLESDGVASEKVSEILQAMMYAGVLGIVRQNRGDAYIYDYSYDIKRMDVLLNRDENPVFSINLGLRPALI